MKHYICERCKKDFGNRKSHYDRHLSRKTPCKPKDTKLIIHKQNYVQKGGVYAIQTALEKLKYPDKCILKIGHACNLRGRFSVYNVGILDDEDLVQNNINFILHFKV